MTAFLKQQMWAIVAALLFLFMLGPYEALVTFIVLGQGHFLLAYLYKWRAGRIKPSGLTWYLLLAVVIFSLPLFFTPETIFLLAAVLFSVHFFFDEARILEGEDQKVSLLAMLPPIGLFLSLVAYKELDIDLVPAAIIGSVITLLGLLNSKDSTAAANPNVWYVNVFAVFFAFLYLLDVPLSGETIFGAIIVMHIVTWYIYYYHKTYSRLDVNSRYITDVLLINVAILILFFGYVNSESFNLLAYFFEPVYYYCWAMLHIVSSSGELFNLFTKRINLLRA